jgi:hypothetical protein
MCVTNTFPTLRKSQKTIKISEEKILIFNEFEI